jgi:AraC-like DNA-binding protein
MESRPQGLPFSVMRTEQLQAASDYTRLDHYVLCWSNAGCGKMRLAFRGRDLPAGRLYLLHPGLVHTFLQYPKSGWVIRFRPQYLLRGTAERLQLHFLPVRNYVDLEPAQMDQLNRLAGYLAETTEENPALLCQYISLLTEQACTFYRAANSMAPVHVHRPMLLRLLELIDSHFREEIWTEFYAQRLGVVARKLNEICTKGTGFLVPELIEDRRLAEAEYLLATTKLLMKEIAAELSFTGSSHFSFWFKQRRSIHPKEFRKMT